MTRMKARSHFLFTASATALVVTAASADAQSMFRKTPRNPAEQAAAAAAQRATQNQAASTATQRTIEAFTRASAIRQRMDAAQAAARAAAMAAASSVPNGLGAGGLQAANGVATDPSLWIGATGPTQATGGDGRTKVEVGQTEAKAILTWDSFNVGRETDLTFNQKGNTNWVALNRVTDASASPSKILGSIKADGTVLVLNRNGVIFGGSAQVNTRNLVAAAADITNDQFLNRGIYSDARAPSFTDALGDVRVEAGAQLVTAPPKTVLDGGGYVMLLGGNVENAGTITTNFGQTLLGAGEAFVLRRGIEVGASAAPSSAFSTTLGTEIDTIGAGAHLARNSGLIQARQADITLIGRQVAQDGVALTTTSVNQRGTIHLLTDRTDADTSVGLSGLTAILPELDSSETALNTQRDAAIAAGGLPVDRGNALASQALLPDRRDQSRIEISAGGDVDFGAASISLAQGGQIAVSAGRRITTETGAILDVSGVRGVALDTMSNAIMVNIQGNELRDSPLNRDRPDRPLYNQNVWINANDLVYVPAGTGGYATDRYYTRGGLLEVSGYLANTSHGIGEWTATGGTITLSAAEVVARQGSVFNISGGSLDYTGGGFLSTRLQGVDGKLYEIGDAPAGMEFISVGRGFVVEHGRWGSQYREVYSNALFNRGVYLRHQDSYTVGRDAGRLVIAAPTALMEGEIVAEIADSAIQTQARPGSTTDGYALGQSQVSLPGVLDYQNYSAAFLEFPTTPDTTDVRIGDVAAVTGGLTPATPITDDRLNTAWFDAASLNAVGLGGLDITTSGAVTIDAPLTLADGGRVDVTAPDIEIAATVTARGGAVRLNAGVAFAGGVIVPPPADGIGVSVDAAIDVRGRWTNGLFDPAGARGAAFVDGGDVTLGAAGFGIVLGEAGSIDASSGAAIFPNGAITLGKGGDVTFDTALTPDIVPGALALDGSVRSFGAAGSGTLTITAPRIEITEATGDVAEEGLLRLAPTLFNTGFSNYVIQADADIVIAAGTTVVAAQPALRLTAAAYDSARGLDETQVLETWAPPLFIEDGLNRTLVQRAGASVTLKGYAKPAVFDPAMPGVLSPNIITIERGASLSVDPFQSVTIEATGQITIDGTITAPGGAIALGNFRGVSPVMPAAYQSFWIGDEARLDVAGRAYTALDRDGRRYGIVQDGGSILLGGTGEVNIPNVGSPVEYVNDANVVIRPGAVLDASGAQATLALPRADAAPFAPGGAFADVAVAGDGGAITFQTASAMYLDGTIRAAAGGAGASGGKLTIESRGNDLAIDSVYRPALPGGVLDPATGNALLPAGPTRIGTDRLAAGGFDDLAFWVPGFTTFGDGVNLTAGRSISFTKGFMTPATADAKVTITAPYIAFKAGNTPLSGSNYVAWSPSAIENDATIDFNASLIDFDGDLYLGRLTYDTSTFPYPVASDVPGFAEARFTASSDIRFVSLDGLTIAGRGVHSSGNVTLNAAQIYAGTDIRGTVEAGLTAAGPSTNLFKPGSTITIGRTTDAIPTAPLSAYGVLTFAADVINQGGIVRAPQGQILLGRGENGGGNTSAVNLLPGSVTSVSLAGLLVPYGGTSDGVRWQYEGTELAYNGDDLGIAGGFATRIGIRPRPGIITAGTAVDVQQGAVLDLTGGGDLAGAGFVTGRGGSVDTLLNPLLRFDGGGGSPTPDIATHPVYAIVPGVSGYAPVSTVTAGTDFTGSTPGIGEQITIGNDVPGLPAGTYTLLPAIYALQPGGYRVELDLASATPSAPRGAPTFSRPDGSFVTTGYRGVRDTAIRDVLPTTATITPGAGVRALSQYNETSLSAFGISSAALFGLPRPALARDAKTLTLTYTVPSADRPALTFDGEGLFTAGEGGIGGTLSVTGNRLEVTADGAAPTEDYVSLRASDLNDVGAARMVIGGSIDRVGVLVGANSTTYDLNIRSGATLRAPEIFLLSTRGSLNGPVGALTIESGAVLDTVGQGPAPYDSSSGLFYQRGNAGLVVVSNGDLIFAQPIPELARLSNPITIEDNVTLRSEGTITFQTVAGLDLGDNLTLATKNLAIGVEAITLGSDAALAAAGAAFNRGLVFSQSTLDRLLGGANTAVTRLTLGADNAINVLGTVNLSAIGADGRQRVTELALRTPAIYGLGDADDVATINAQTLVWDVPTAQTRGFPEQLPPGPIVPGGPGTGSGTLRLVAERIVLGAPADQAPFEDVRLDHRAVGFGAVELVASESIMGRDKSTLAVYQTQLDPATPGVGGNLTLSTPVLSGFAGSVLDLTAGGTLRIVSDTARPADAALTGVGATIGLTGASVVQDGNILAPSGRVTLTATTGDVTLTARSRTDLAGRGIAVIDRTVYGWGGDLLVNANAGDIAAAAGSVIDVSAVNADAGSIALSVPTGQAVMAGTLSGGTSYVADASSGDDEATHVGGSLALSVGTMSSADFAAFNVGLDSGGFTESRRFAVASGDLVVGDLAAHEIGIATGGALTIDGTLDASGARVGSIRLAAGDDLVLAAGAVLDAHGSDLRVDSYGQAIDATNRAHIELASSDGRVRLGDGVALDVRSADDGATDAFGRVVHRGLVTINVARVGGNDAAIDVGGGIGIAGAGTVAVNAFRTYTPGDGTIAADGTIDQAQFDAIHAQNVDYIGAALGNAGLRGRLGGLGSAVSFQPGVEIASDGDLKLFGEIDLHTFRYTGLDGAAAATPGTLLVRTSGTLTVNGSLSDGFGDAPDNPDGLAWSLPTGVPLSTEGSDNVAVLPVAITVGAGSQIESGIFGRAVTFEPLTINGLAAPLPIDITLTPSFGYDPVTFQPSDNYFLFNSAVTKAPITQPDGTVIPAGTSLPSGFEIQSGAVLGAGNSLPLGRLNIAAPTFPAGTDVSSIEGLKTVSANTPVLVIPKGTALTQGTVLLATADAADPSLIPLRGDGTGKVLALAPLLTGDRSWSMRLVGGADLASADTRAVRAAGQLGDTGDLILSDPHYAIRQSVYGNIAYAALPSVLRTGTGELDLVAGRDYRQESIFGVYTAGTNSPEVGGTITDVVDPGFGRNVFDRTRGKFQQNDPDTFETVYATVDLQFGREYEALATQDYHAYYPEHGGDLLLSAGRDVRAFSASLGDPQSRASGSVNQWLWVQGGAALDQSTAWWINFGSYGSFFSQGNNPGGAPVVNGFMGIGTLGGGNVAIVAGGDAGTNGDALPGGFGAASGALDVAAASTGRVVSAANREIVITGGGDVRIDIGGALNLLEGNQNGGDIGSVTVMRGDATVTAESIGRIEEVYGFGRLGDPIAATTTDIIAGGLTMLPGDGSIALTARGDLAYGGIGEPTRLVSQNVVPFTYVNDQGERAVAQEPGTSNFSLWSDTTAISAITIGGNLSGAGGTDVGSRNAPLTTAYNAQGYSSNEQRFTITPILRAIAPEGSIFRINGDLAPSPVGQLDILAGESVYAVNVSISGAPVDSALRTSPFNPAFIGTYYTFDQFGQISNEIAVTNILSYTQYGFDRLPNNYFAFAPDIPVGDIHANDPEPSRVYARDGDLVNVVFGNSAAVPPTFGGSTAPTLYRGAEPVRMIAGRDILASRGFIYQGGADDISVLRAGRDIQDAQFDIAGRGLLDLQAGRNFYQGDGGSLRSIGNVFGGADRVSGDGAGIAITAGVGAAGPDYAAFANLYLDPANAVGIDGQIADGGVPLSYDDEMLDFLRTRFGYAGDAADARATFDALPVEQRAVFLRTVYYNELREGGREYNNPDSNRFGSYLRGNRAIETLFAKTEGDSTAGNFTMFGNASVATQFGGGIDFLVPNGAITLGVAGGNPPSGTAGVVTFGSGDILSYSKASVLLGRSRLFTTFGGDILIWSAEGDIAAGQGAKTTVVFQPPLRQFDDIGNVTLSPPTTVSGAGIATLNPIAAVPPGDVDLIAPLGTIDAGEAGIRVSGNVNIAALNVLNAANIQVQGESAGLPVVAAVNTGALTAASSAASAVAIQAERLAERSRPKPLTDIPTILNVRFIGFGEG